MCFEQVQLSRTHRIQSEKLLKGKYADLIKNKHSNKNTSLEMADLNVVEEFAKSHALQFYEAPEVKQTVTLSDIGSSLSSLSSGSSDDQHPSLQTPVKKLAYKKKLPTQGKRKQEILIAPTPLKKSPYTKIRTLSSTPSKSFNKSIGKTKGLDVNHAKTLNRLSAKMVCFHDILERFLFI